RCSPSPRWPSAPCCIWRWIAASRSTMRRGPMRHRSRLAHRVRNRKGPGQIVRGLVNHCDVVALLERGRLAAPLSEVVVDADANGAALRVGVGNQVIVDAIALL